MKKRHLLLLALGLSACSQPPARSTEHRVMLASQHDWDGKRGFYITLENSGEGTVPLRSLKLILGVGDGVNWRFLSASPDWKAGKDYTARAVLTPDNAELWLDGVRLETKPGRLSPMTGPVVGNLTPSWASGPADYVVSQSSLKLSSGAGRSVSAKLPYTTDSQAAVRLFEPSVPMRADWAIGAGETTTVEATFRFLPPQSLRPLAPFIDRYGQSRHAKWDGKITNDAGLKKAAATEAERTKGWKRPAKLDAYGGATDAGWTESPTGFYRVVQRNGMSWLITPLGNPTFYIGVCTADVVPFERTPVSDREYLFEELPPKTGEYAAAWGRDIWSANDGADYVSFYTANLVRKYGSGWEQKAEQAIRDRVSRFGFSGLGKWTDDLKGLPSLPVLFHGDVPNISRHPDIFDPAVRETFRESLRRQITPRKSDPYLIGWSVGNEYPEVVLKTEVVEILAKGSTVPAKRALIDHGIEAQHGGSVEKAASAWGVSARSREELYATTPRPGDADAEAMRRFYAGRYYKFIYDTIKSIDPNHLYFGYWIVPYWWENEEDWRLIAPYCDVIGYDRYNDSFSDATIDRLMKETAKPVLCGEFSFPPHYGGTRGFGVYPTWSESDADAGRKYTIWVRDAAKNPYCVGLFYFQYRDQPLTGRGPGRGDRLVIDERFAFGLVDITDRPKWDFVTRVRDANLSATRQRLEATARPQR